MWGDRIFACWKSVRGQSCDAAVTVMTLWSSIRSGTTREVRTRCSMLELNFRDIGGDFALGSNHGEDDVEAV